MELNKVSGVKMSHAEEVIYQSVLKLVDLLPKKDRLRLVDHLQSEPTDDHAAKKIALKELLENAPVWTDEDLARYQEARDSINNAFRTT